MAGAAEREGKGVKQKTNYRHMTRTIAEEIRRLYFSRQAKQAELAERYGIRQNSVSRIVSGKVWS